MKSVLYRFLVCITSIMPLCYGMQDTDLQCSKQRLYAQTLSNKYDEYRKATLIGKIISLLWKDGTPISTDDQNWIVSELSLVKDIVHFVRGDLDPLFKHDMHYKIYRERLVRKALDQAKLRQELRLP